MKPFIQIYSPETTKDIVGQDKAIQSLRDNVMAFKKTKKAALLYGPTGTGKTSSVKAFADEMGWELIEINASSQRNKDQIEKIVGSATTQMSLFAAEKIILLDEIDGLSGQKDRGGAAAVAKIISKSGFPIVMTCRDPYDEKLKPVRKLAEAIEFHTMNYLSIVKILKKIADNEKIEYEEDALKTFARMAGGDTRAAINDFQMITANSGSLKKADLEMLSERDTKESIINALMKVFKTSDYNVAAEAYDNIEEDFDKVMLWLDENLPKEYEKPHELDLAYDKMSRADIYTSRIRRRQHWRFLVYIRALLSAGIASSKDEKYRKFTKYSPTTRLLKIWQANMKFGKRKGICEKIAAKTHTSTKYVMENSFPYVKLMIKGRDRKRLIEYFDFDKDEVAFMMK